jgi:hypothetical protein
MLANILIFTARHHGEDCLIGLGIRRLDAVLRGKVDVPSIVTD